MMNKVLAIAAIAGSTSAVKTTPAMAENLAKIQAEGIAADSSFGQHLLSKSRRVEQNNYGQQYDMSFVSNYSIKFLGCHHVTQWNSDADEDNNNDQNQEAMTLSNSRIQSKGLVRFRLCPSNSCHDGFSTGCSKDYGEYVVDMVQFLQVYVAYQQEEQEYKCSTYRNTCYKNCYESTNANCYSSCYKKYGVNVAMCASNDGAGNYYNQNVNGNAAFSLEDYLECAEYKFGGDTDDLVHYLGPYCATQGGDIRLGFFTDETCTLASSNQANYFEKLTGVEVPYTKASIVSTNCMSCEAKEDANDANANQDYYNYDANGNRNYYIAKEVNDLCGKMYMQSGKCETNMNSEDVPYPEDGACTYIEGVKRLKSDGIIRSDNTVNSKPAAISIGVFTGLAVLLGGYVYYLKSKIARSRVNLAGANVSLT